MKLSLKIFFSMSISALVASVLVLGIIMDKNYKINIQKEKERTIAEFSNIINNIEYNYEAYSQITIKDIIDTYNNYYEKNDLQFIYAYGNSIEHLTDMQLNDFIPHDILDTNNNIFLSKVVDDGEQQYLCTSTSFKNDVQKKIICVRDITYIYETQKEIRLYGIIIIFATTACIAILSFAISKNMTIQLRIITEGTKNISRGEYDLHFQEGNNEFGKLSKAFNKMAEDIRNRTNELVSLVDSKQIFIDNLSHEMNTPLTTIQGYAEYIERANISPEEQTKYLQYIQQESKRIKDIYKKLLLLSYKKENDLEIINQKFKPIIEEIKQQVENKRKEKNIELIINNKLNFLQCDKTLAQMAISNLIINAISVSKEESQIIVNCYENGNKIIEVIDFGIGISEENIEKILEPFYRVDKSRSREQGGAGLGLSICKNIMEMHNGKIHIESKIGQGSKFILIFP